MLNHRTTKQSIIGAAVDKQVVTALTAMVQNGIPVTNNVIDQQIQHIRESQAPLLHVPHHISMSLNRRSVLHPPTSTLHLSIV